mmetsp:Transcript_17781/g.54377  ORF Transcript_17781/g.54377 Transcript_17781/m.54377 type:complete len:224 (+) Transcript_17781:228-899(+)
MHNDDDDLITRRTPNRASKHPLQSLKTPPLLNTHCRRLWLRRGTHKAGTRTPPAPQGFRLWVEGFEGGGVWPGAATAGPQSHSESETSSPSLLLSMSTPLRRPMDSLGLYFAYCSASCCMRPNSWEVRRCVSRSALTLAMRILLLLTRCSMGFSESSGMPSGRRLSRGTSAASPWSQSEAESAASRLRVGGKMSSLKKLLSLAARGSRKDTGSTALTVSRSSL